VRGLEGRWCVVAKGRESLGKIHAKLAPTLTPRQAHENESQVDTDLSFKGPIWR